MADYNFYEAMYGNKSEKQAANETNNVWTNQRDDDIANFKPVYQEQEQEQYQPEPQAPQAEQAPRITNSYWTPTRIVAEAEAFDRDPDYVSPSGQSRDVVLADRNYVQEMFPGLKSTDDDPGWSEDNSFYTGHVAVDYAIPEEPEAPSAQSQTQAVQEQPVQAGIQIERTEQQTEPQNTPDVQQEAESQGRIGLQNPGNTASIVNAQPTEETETVPNQQPQMSFNDIQQAVYAVLTPEQRAMTGMDIPTGDYDQLSAEGKLYYLIFTGSAGTDVENAPGYARYTQPMLMSYLSSGGIANDLALAATLAGAGDYAGAVRLGAQIATMAYTYNKQIGNIEGIPAIDKVLELQDKLDEAGSIAQGRIMLASRSVGVEDLSDWNHILLNLGKIGNDPIGFAKALISGPKEYSPEVVKAVLKYTPDVRADLLGGAPSRIAKNIGAIFMGGEDIISRTSTTRYNAGQSGVHELGEENVGTEALIHYMDILQRAFDLGMTDEKDLDYYMGMMVTGTFGDTTNLAQLLEHEMGDLSNVSEGVQSRTAYAVGKVTGDKNLQTAAKANMGNIFEDFIMPTALNPVQGIIQQGAKFAGKELHTSGGIDELLDAYKIENITSPLDTVTPLGRTVSGITKDGTIRGVATPNNPKQKLLNFFKETNESKALYEADTILDYVSVLVDDALRANGADQDQTVALQQVEDFLNQLEHPELIAEDSPMYNFSQSALFNSMKDDMAMMVSRNREKINKRISQYMALQDNVKILNTVATALNLKPSEVVSMYDNQKTVLTQMIVNKADQNGGKLPGIDLDVTGQDFGKEVIAKLQPFAGDNGLAWDVRQVTLQVTTDIADGLADTLTEKYNIKPDGWVYRFGDAIKKMQGLLLLGLSPSYLANNFLNNLVTRNALGYGGYMTAKQMNDWNTRFGFNISRFEDSAGAEIGQKDYKTGGYERVSNKIADVKRVKDAFNTIGNFGSQASEKLGVFSKFSNKVEHSESMQIITSAQRTYMARTWKPGVNYRKMDARLESAIDSQVPGLSKAIYAAISAGVNMEEIQDAIYGSFVIPSIRESLIEAAQAVSKDNAEELITELFEKGGVVEKLEQALKGKRGEDIDSAIDQVKQQLEKTLNIQLATDLATRAEAIQNQVAGEGWNAALDLAIDLSDQMTEVWITSQATNNHVFEERIKSGMTPQEFHALYQKEHQVIQSRWNQVYNTNLQSWSGILHGLGSKGRKAKFLEALNKKQRAWTEFYSYQDKQFNIYLKAAEYRTATGRGKRPDTLETWQSRTQNAWKTYQQNMQSRYEKTIANEKKYQQQMDEAFLSTLKEPLGSMRFPEAQKVLQSKFDAIHAKRDEITQLQQETRARANNVQTINEVDTVWEEIQGQLTNLKTELGTLQRDLYNTIREYGQLSSNAEESDATSEPDYETAIRNDMTETEAKATRDSAEKFSDLMTDIVNKTESVDDVENVQPEEYSDAIKRNNLRDIATRAGATKEQAEAYARYVGAVAKSWENSHPGKDFFEDAFGVRLEYIDEERTADSEERIKGQFKIENGEKIAQLFRGSDFSSMVHETAHGFATTLNDSQVEALAQYNGWTAEEYRHLENQYYYEPDSMSAEDKQRWVDSQEKFAYGFEQYLMEGKAPSSAMAVVFEAFRSFLLEIYKGVKNLVYKGEKIDIHEERNGVTLAQIFDSMLENYAPQQTETTTQAETDPLAQIAQRQQTIDNYEAGQFTQLDAIPDLTQITAGDALREYDAKVTELAQKLYNAVRADSGNDKEHLYPIERYKQYIYDESGEDGKPYLSKEIMDTIDFQINFLPDKDAVRAEVERLRAGKVYTDDIPAVGTFVGKVYEFEHGSHKIKAEVYQDGKLVAYVPTEFPTGADGQPLTEVRFDDEEGSPTFRVIGYSPSDKTPDNLVYMVGDNFYECDPHRWDKPNETNPLKPEVKRNTVPALDPVPQANAQVTYETVEPILNELARIYKKNLEDARSNKMLSKLDEDTQRLVKAYIDKIIRTDLANTKYKTGKFSEMMRDAALLNYSKRYGFDNFLTLICPYQFWATRSFMNWTKRMTSHPKLFRTYARLKDMEDRNKKEFMPSKVSGKWGVPLPFLPDWMGGKVFMSMEQLFPMMNFANVFEDYDEDKENVIISTAKEYLAQMKTEGRITSEEYSQAINPATRNDSPYWQEAYAQAQLTESSDNSLPGLLQDFLGLSVPLSIGQSLYTGDNSSWNQFPITRFGNNMRALIGDNWIGKGVQGILTAPEKALRKATEDEFGSTFEYNEFGNWGDYYIKLQIRDMMIEGLIDPLDGIEAMVEKDGNAIWEQAAERQRQENLMKMQGGGALRAIKQMAEDYKGGEMDSDMFWKDFFGVMTEIVLSPFGQTIVREGETEWRHKQAERSEAMEQGKEATNQFYDENPEMSYANLAFQTDDEQILRQGLYKVITQNYYDLSLAEQEMFKETVGTDFERSIINKDTRAIETMDIYKLTAYARALTGRAPYGALEKLGYDKNQVEVINVPEVPQTDIDIIDNYYKERDTLYPGMSSVDKIYWKLNAEDRKAFSEANPNLAPYQEWNKKQKEDNDVISAFSKRRSDYYNLKECENASVMASVLLRQEIAKTASSGKKVNEAYYPEIDRIMREVGSTDTRDKFIKQMQDYFVAR